ncbi:MAG TPA: 4a-hydroxytetrahydrobiopterin dehydratase [Nitrospiria bacterium]|nr:4a-hydroxytetrahydrobiopterin dehydratase [Nitrospiria bacterium]
MAEKLSSGEIQNKLKALNGWQWSDNAIKKQYVFESFMPAIRFVNRVAELAEAVDHHPDITINYRKVTMGLSTHSAGGLTQKDFALAEKIDGAVAEPR